MKKKMKMISFLLILILCLGMTIPAYAEDSEGFADEYYRVQDQADLMTDSEESELLDVLDEISIRQKMDVIVMTTDTLEGLTVEEFADDMYDYYEYGYGADKDGVLLLISTEDNDVYISTCGYGITAFTDAGIKYIPKQMMDDLKSQDYFSACMTFAELCDDFITQARNGSPYTARTLPKDALPFYWIFISIGVGVILAFIIVGRMKAQLKTVRFQAAAGNYVKDGSMNVTESRDLFLYHTVTKTAKEKSSSGSSTHTSSSGRTHGGGGTKF